MKTTKMSGINLTRLLSFVLLMLIASLTACTSIKGNKTQLSKVTNKIGAKQDASRAEKTSATKSAKAGEVVAKSGEVQAEPQAGADLFPQTETPAKTAYVDQSTANVAEPTLPMEEGKPEGQKPDDFFLREDSIPLPVIAVTKGTGSIDDDRPFMEKVIEEDPGFARKIEAKNSSDYETQWALIFERQDAAARQLAEAKRIRAEVIAEEQAAALAEAETDATPTEDALMQTTETPVPTPTIEIKPAIVVSKESPSESKTSTTFTRPIMTVVPAEKVVSKVSNGFLVRSTLEVRGLPNTECVNLGELIIRPVNNGSDNIFIKFGPKDQADGDFVKLIRESEIVAENMRSGLVLKDEPLATYFRYPLTVSGKVSQGDVGAAVEYEITVLTSERVDGIQMWASAESDSYEFTNASITRKSNQPLVVAQNAIREAEKTWSPQATDEISFAGVMAMITRQYAVGGNIFSPLTDRLSMVNVGPGNSKGHDNLMLAGVGGSFGVSAKTKAGLIFLGMILIVVLLYTLLYRCGALSDSLRLAFFGQPLTREQQLDAVPFERSRETFLERKFNPNAFKALAKAGLQKLKPRRRTVTKAEAKTDVVADDGSSPEQNSETAGSIPVASEQMAPAQDAKSEAKDETPKSAEENPEPAKVGVVSPFTLAGPPKTEGPKDVKTQKTVLPPKRNIPAKTPTPAPASTATPPVITIPLPSGNVPNFELLVDSVAKALAAQLGLDGKTTGGQIPDETPSGSVKKPFRLGGNSPKPQGFKSVNAWEKENDPPPKHQPKPKPLFPLPDQQEETVADEADAQSGTGPNPPAPPQTDTAA